MRYKRSASILLSIALLLSLIGCTKSSEDTESKIWRDEYSNTESDKKFIDTDGDFKFEMVDWSGPEDYKIVYPSGDEDAHGYAMLIKNYFDSLCGTKMSVVSDGQNQNEKEILIGKTNRKESNRNIAISDLEVSLKNDKLVFDAGHTVTLKSAVDKFLRLKADNKKIAVFKITTDFKDTVLDGYKYVWGDEFEGNDIDLTKWDFEERMSGSGQIEISWDKDVVDVADGRLKLHAINYFDELREGTRYKVPYSVVTKYKMNFKYGYAEIRARVPYYRGSWPSFWGLSLLGQGGTKATGGLAYDEKKKVPYGVEVDIFEIFGSLNEVIPNVHKWYRSEVFNYGETFGLGEVNHTELSNKKIWDWKEKDVDLNNLSNEYHLYGFEWTDKEMSFYVDGEKYYTLDIVNSYDLYQNMDGFHMPIFLMFNNHVFADDAFNKNLIEEHSLLPFCYYIDWCRVYQKPGVGELYIDNTPNEYAGR